MQVFLPPQISKSIRIIATVADNLHHLSRVATQLSLLIDTVINSENVNFFRIPPFFLSKAFNWIINSLGLQRTVVFPQ